MISKSSFSNKYILQNNSSGNRYEMALMLKPQNLTNELSIMVQVMAWCHQATSHYLSQCWPRSMSPYGVTRTQWVNTDNKMADTMQATFLKNFLNENICILIKISPNNIPKGLVMLPDNNSASVQIMACCYHDQCWAWSMMSYGVTTAQRVN